MILCVSASSSTLRVTPDRLLAADQNLVPPTAIPRRQYGDRIAFFGQDLLVDELTHDY